VIYHRSNNIEAPS